MKRFVSLFILIYYVATQPIYSQTISATNTLLWEISGKDLKNPSYLFGTFHLLCPADMEVTDALKNKLKITQQLVLELDFDDPNMMTEMQKYMVLPTGKTIKDYLSTQEFEMISQFFQDSVGIPLEQLERIKPFVLSSFLYPKFLGCQPASWEQVLTQLAQSQQAEVLGLETVQQQMTTIDKMTFDQQANMLVESITKYNDMKKMAAEMVEMYKKQEVERIYNFAGQYFNEYAGLEKAMLEDRNRKWVPQMEKMIKAKPTFFGVGAGHLGGKNGVIALLKAKGYKVIPVANTDETSKSLVSDNAVAKLLTRKWKMEESVIPQAVEDVIDNVRKQNPEQAKQLETQKTLLTDGLRVGTVEYKANGKYEMKILGNVITGAWKLNIENTQLIRVDEKGEESVNEIVEITKDKLVIINTIKRKIIYIPL